MSKRDSWVVHKLGGTSLADAERYRRAGEIMSARGEPRQAVVVSAMAKVTDTLLGIAQSASAGEPDVDLSSLEEKVIGVARQLLSEPEATQLEARVQEDLLGLRELVRAAARMRSAEPTLLALVAGLGEQWSSLTLAAHLRDRGRQVVAVDARGILFLDPDGNVDRERSRAAWRAFETEHPELDAVVITGFIATAHDGRATTLGRNGSDHSATLFADLLDAARVTIWTDVAGVLTADPRRVPSAQRVPVLSYAEAMELAYFGAKVIHPKTMGPVVARKIPIEIKSSLDPDAPGTLIDAEGRSDQAVKAITTIERMALIEIAGSGMIGVPGIARRLFAQLEAGGLSVVLISQGSSEHSICFAVPDVEAERAIALVNEAFFSEQHRGLIRPAKAHRDCAILAVVGDGMAGHTGVSGRTFNALGRASVNVRAIAQGASERNVSVVVDERDATRALRAVHSGFWLSRPTLSVAIIGTGVVGGALVDQLASMQESLPTEAGVELRVRGIANSRKMLLGDPAIQLASGEWRQQIEEGVPADMGRLLAHLTADGAPHAAIVDLTANDGMADRYAAWLASGLHVVTANKRAGSGPRERYDRTKNAARGRGSAWLFETTVGAGLPVIGTLRDLVETGDRPYKIEGLLSGTLSWLFTTWNGEMPFSAVVKDAKERGYTEPDVRDDLSGMDVARKLVILAREAGYAIDLEHVKIDGLVPEALASVSPKEALERLPMIDDALAARYAKAEEEGRVLRFAALLEGDRVEVGLRTFSMDHPFASAQGTDNVIQLTTQRYSDRPLVVQGPGAGPEVTAGGVFAELIRLTRALGA